MVGADPYELRLATYGGQQPTRHLPEIAGRYVTAIWPTVVRFASRTGKVGLTWSSKPRRLFCGAGSVVQHRADFGSLVTSCLVTPARLCVHVRIESVVSACESSTGRRPRSRCGCGPQWRGFTDELWHDEWMRDPKSYPAPLKRRKDSSSNSVSLFLRDALDERAGRSSIGPTACRGSVVSRHGDDRTVAEVRRRSERGRRSTYCSPTAETLCTVGLHVGRNQRRGIQRQRRALAPVRVSRPR